VEQPEDTFRIPLSAILAFLLKQTALCVSYRWWMADGVSGSNPKGKGRYEAQTDPSPKQCADNSRLERARPEPGPNSELTSGSGRKNLPDAQIVGH
jgi:hypothetical protein